jgi:surface protein
MFSDCSKLDDPDLSGLNTRSVTTMESMFYGCSSLKEVSVPTGVYEICEYYPEIPAETFAGCTSLERVMFDLTGANINAGVRMFYNCSNLTEIKLSAKITSKSFYDIYEDAFAGCAKLKEVPIYSTVYIYGSPFAGSGIETLTLQLKAEAGSIFAGATQLKEVYIKKNSLSLHADTFANLSTEINFYFYEQTRAQVISACGEEWLQNADEKAHFYFKDTMPE